MRKDKVIGVDNRVAKLVGELRCNANHFPDKRSGVADIGPTNYLHSGWDIAVAFHPRAERPDSNGSVGRCLQLIDAFMRPPVTHYNQAS